MAEDMSLGCLSCEMASREDLLGKDRENKRVFGWRIVVLFPDNKASCLRCLKLGLGTNLEPPIQRDHHSGSWWQSCLDVCPGQCLCGGSRLGGW